MIYVGDSTLRAEYIALVERLHPHVHVLKQHKSVAQRRRRTKSDANGLTNRLGRTILNKSRCAPSQSETYFKDNGICTDYRFDFGGRMLCDCFRLKPTRKGDCCNEAVDNRVYYGQLSTGESFQLAYFQWFGQWHAPRGNLNIQQALSSDGCAECANLPCAPGFGSESGWQWSLSIADLLHSLAAVRPTHVILNAGHWDTAAVASAEWAAIAEAGAALKREHRTRIIWRTTPRHKHAMRTPYTANRSYSVDIGPFVAAGWELYDAMGIFRAYATRMNRSRYTSSLFCPDAIHLYQGGNNALVDYVLQNIVGDAAASATQSKVGGTYHAPDGADGSGSSR